MREREIESAADRENEREGARERERERVHALDLHATRRASSSRNRIVMTLFPGIRQSRPDFGLGGMRLSRPDSGLGVQVKVLDTSEVAPSHSAPGTAVDRTWHMHGSKDQTQALAHN